MGCTALGSTGRYGSGHPMMIPSDCLWTCLTACLTTCHDCAAHLPELLMTGASRRCGVFGKVWPTQLDTGSSGQRSITAVQMHTSIGGAAWQTTSQMWNRQVIA